MPSLAVSEAVVVSCDIAIRVYAEDVLALDASTIANSVPIFVVRRTLGVLCALLLDVVWRPFPAGIHASTLARDGLWERVATCSQYKQKCSGGKGRNSPNI